MTRYFLLILLALTGCTQRPCKVWSTVKHIGQCACTYKCYTNTCVATLEDGEKVERSEPYVEGEKVCVAR